MDRASAPLMLRAVEQNDALYRAALAIASIHKTVLLKRRLIVKLDEDQYAIKHYTRALRCLSLDSQKNASNPLEVVLLACLLFIGFEVKHTIHCVVFC